MCISSICSNNHKLNVNVQFRKEYLEALANIMYKTAMELSFFLGRFVDSDQGGRPRERDRFTPCHELSICVCPIRTIFQDHTVHLFVCVIL